MSGFALAPTLDVDALAARFASERRLRIQPFLTDTCAVDLHARLRGRDDWVQLVNSGGKVFELSRAARAGLTPEQARILDDAVTAGAREGFQYRYEALRLPDGDLAYAAGEDPLAPFARWLSEGAARAFLRSVTGAEFTFADAQATAYSPGDFLTGHDDAVAGKQRLSAYVLGLTPVWRPEWGGLLLFHGADGAVAGHAPGFNSLDLFAVPQLHSVSAVTQSAAFRRYAITGWLRQGR